MLNKDNLVIGVDLAGVLKEHPREYKKDESVILVWNENDITTYYSTFSVNPYICKVCGKSGFANDKVLCNKKVGMGENIICEECANERLNIEITDIRGEAYI